MTMMAAVLTLAAVGLLFVAAFIVAQPLLQERRDARLPRATPPPDPIRYDGVLYAALYDQGDWGMIEALWTDEEVAKLAPRRMYQLDTDLMDRMADPWSVFYAGRQQGKTLAQAMQAQQMGPFQRAMLAQTQAQMMGPTGFTPAPFGAGLARGLSQILGGLGGGWI